MLKNGIFEKSSKYRKLQRVSFILTLSGSNGVHMQRLELYIKYRILCPNRAILIIILCLGTLASVVLPLFYTKNWHADLEFSCRFYFLVLIRFSYMASPYVSQNLF